MASKMATMPCHEAIKSREDHNFFTKSHRNVIFESNYRFSNPKNTMEHVLISYNVVKYKMAATRIKYYEISTSLLY